MKKVFRLFCSLLVVMLIFSVQTAYAEGTDSTSTLLHGIWSWVKIGALIVGALIVIGDSAFTVDQNHVRIRERFGKFISIHKAGLDFKIPFIDTVTRQIFLGLEEIEINLQTKTKDNVFVELGVSIQKKTSDDKVQKMWYELGDPEKQMESFVMNVIRAEVPKMTLDELFEKKDEIAESIKASLSVQMNQYGFEIESTQIKDIDPDEKVKESMNSVQASVRNRQAAENNAEAAKITLVKAAEAKKEADILHGEGIAGQREKIAEGMGKSIEIIKKADGNASEKEITALILTAQYFDTMKEIGANGKNTVVFLPNSPGGITETVMSSIMGSNFATKETVKQDKG